MDRNVGQPLPVFMMDGSRVVPADQEATLKGALVDVHVAITHQAIEVCECGPLTFKRRLTIPRDRARTTVSTDIRSTTVLRGPGYGPGESSLSKCGVRLPEHLRAAKRQKIA
jgi:hypothetical protein